MTSDNVTPIRPAPATEPRFPVSVSDKIVTAKSIVQAVIAAEESTSLAAENFDSAWPLAMAVELLEQAAEEVEKAEDAASILQMVALLPTRD